MPVRFRCHHCNQLLGIARRKIGTEVSCPTCRKMLLVPAVDSPDVDRPAERNNPIFEGSDLDALLQPGAAPQLAAELAPPAPAAAPATAWAPPAPAAFEAAPYNPPGPVAPAAAPPGVVLSPVQATIFTVGIVVLLAVFFAAGLLIGRFLL